MIPYGMRAPGIQSKYHGRFAFCHAELGIWLTYTAIPTFSFHDPNPPGFLHLDTAAVLYSWT